MGMTMGKSGTNFFDSLPSQALHVVMLGLDSAGKTTALYRLKFDQYLNTVPTIGFNCEKVQGTIGKAKGVQFLVWDVGGQEKLRPLWRSYTRCTDGILFVVDSVDIERMEEAKIELMRTAKCPDNQGVPVLVLANKQDLPGACDPKQLETYLGLQELQYHTINMTTMGSCHSSSTTNIINSTSSNSGNQTQNNLALRSTKEQGDEIKKREDYGFILKSSVSDHSNTILKEQESFGDATLFRNQYHASKSIDSHSYELSSQCTQSESPTTPIVKCSSKKLRSISPSNSLQYKGWYVQAACAITGEGLQEGLEVLYEMIVKRRKLNKACRKKR